MTIVLVNYRYFVSGGPERYYFNVKELLERHGHKVIPFSIKNSRNLPTEYEQYFLDSTDDEVYFAQSKKKLSTIIPTFTRMFYSRSAAKKFGKLLDDTKPDLVYIMQYHNKISPSIIYAAKKRGLPVVHRISDFQYMCPNALFYNDVKGVCEDCLQGKKLSCVKYRCVHGSRFYSFIKLMAKQLHDNLHVTRKIDDFIVPSSFTLEKLKQYGIKDSKLHHIPTYFNQREISPNVSYGDFALFIGRIERQKGLLTLIKAFVGTDRKLKIIGFSNDGYDEELKEYLKDKKHNIEFLGRMEFDSIVSYLKGCLFTVVPSEWYDNFPNVILESFAYKKGVIATDFGSLPELVVNGKTGLTFSYGDVEALKEKVNKLFSQPSYAEQLGEGAYKSLEDNYLAEKHYESIINVFSRLIKQ